MGRRRRDRRTGSPPALDEDERVDSDRLRAVLLEHVVSTVAELLAPGTERYEFLADQVHQLGRPVLLPGRPGAGRRRATA